MIQLKYIGKHKPEGMIAEVEEKDVERLLESGEYERLGKKPIKEVKKEIKDVSSKRTFKRL